MTALTPQQKERQRAESARERLRLGPAGAPILTYTAEADIRSSLATLAYAYGWQVQEEVVISGWGRIDLVISDESPGSVLIELKLALTKPSDIRRGFQQADGYGRWWVANRAEQAQVILASAEANSDLVAPVAARYPEIHCLPVNQVMAGLAIWGRPIARLGVAQARADAVSNLLEIHDHAVKRLDGAR